MLGPNVELAQAFPGVARECLVESDFAAPAGGPATLAVYSTASFPTAGLPFGFAPGSLNPFVFRLSMMDYTTAADDPDRPSEQWDGRLVNPGEITRSVRLTPVGDAQIEASSGEIVIANTDGEYDTVLDDYTAVGQEIAVRVGLPGARWADFDTVARMRITGYGITQDAVNLSVEDTSARLSMPYPTTTYAGTGGIEGDVEIADQQRQVVLGRAWNVRATLINRTLLIYQLHDGPVSQIIRLMDSGVVLTASDDVASYALLAGAAPAPGAYRTCLSLGLVRLGDDPAGPVTADMVGHAPAGSSIASLASHLAVAVGGLLNVPVDTAAFAALPDWQAGWVWEAPFTYGEAIGRFVGDGGYVWGAGLAGVLTCGQLREPDPAAVSLRLDASDILSIERVALPPEYEATHGQRVVRCGRVWRPLASSEVAANAHEGARRQVEWRQVTALAAPPLMNASLPEPLDTSLTSAVSARTLAQQLIALHGRRRQAFEVQTKMFGTLPALLSNVTLEHPRFGLAGGKTFRLYGMRMSLQDGTITYHVWG